jgi:hypothetical protein
MATTSGWLDRARRDLDDRYQCNYIRDEYVTDVGPCNFIADCLQILIVAQVVPCGPLGATFYSHVGSGYCTFYPVTLSHLTGIGPDGRCFRRYRLVHVHRYPSDAKRRGSLRYHIQCFLRL